jgi:hypothetical protein
VITDTLGEADFSTGRESMIVVPDNLFGNDSLRRTKILIVDSEIAQRLVSRRLSPRIQESEVAGVAEYASKGLYPKIQDQHLPGKSSPSSQIL